MCCAQSKAPIPLHLNTLNYKNSPWIDYRGDICRHLRLLAHATLPSAVRKEEDVCAVKMSDHRGGTYALFLFINVFLLSLLSYPPVQGTPSLVGTKQREETQMRDEYLVLSFSLSLYLFTLHFSSCHRSILSQWEFTIWHSGF